MSSSGDPSPITDPQIIHLVTQETRTEILARLATADSENGVSISALSDAIEKHKSTIHQHLTDLAEADIVTSSTVEAPHSTEHVFYTLTEYGSNIVKTMPEVFETDE